jgi:hypothetical protein
MFNGDPLSLHIHHNLRHAIDGADRLANGRGTTFATNIG